MECGPSKKEEVKLRDGENADLVVVVVHQELEGVHTVHTVHIMQN